MALRLFYVLDEISHFSHSHKNKRFNVTAIGKALAIFIFAVSICYLAMSVLVWQVQIPDWKSKIAVLNEYSIVSQPGEKVTWIATNRVTKAQVRVPWRS